MMAIINQRNICMTMFSRKILHKMKYIKRPHHLWSRMFSRDIVRLYLLMVRLVQVNILIQNFISRHCMLFDDRSIDYSVSIINHSKGKTHTMLGPNPRKVAGTPTSSSGDIPPKTAMSIQTQSTEGGLMVKAMDEIFRHVEQADNPESFKVIMMVYLKKLLIAFWLIHGHYDSTKSNWILRTKKKKNTATKRKGKTQFKMVCDLAKKYSHTIWMRVHINTFFQQNSKN